MCQLFTHARMVGTRNWVRMWGLPQGMIINLA